MTTPSRDSAADVERDRRRLLSLAFRMTGTLTDAEDVVQETYLRWYRLDDAEPSSVENTSGWLTRVASRLALDHLGSARVRRERYVGQWLPEPVPTGHLAGSVPRRADLVAAATAEPDPLDRITLDDAVSTALLVVLESMTPAERVAFVLHDVFGLSFAEVAEIVGRSPEAARQLASSGRRHVREDRAVAVSRDQHDAAVRAFLAAARTGDIGSLASVLAPGAELRSDGGGVVSAAPNVVVGAPRVARFVLGLLAKDPSLDFAEEQTGDGLGYRIRASGRLLGVVTFGVVDGLVADVWLMLNPDKLRSWEREARYG